jgi:hypothetical protein
MSRIIGISAAWLAATLVAVAVAAAAVGSVRSEVTDAPTALAAPMVAVAATVPTPEPETATTTTTVFALPAPTTPVPITDSTTTTADADQDDTPSGSPVTTTTPAATSTTTTTASSYTKTYDTDAGSVRITVSGESVTFAGAIPLPGWTVELENSGPEEVNVHFERNDDEGDEEEIEFKATIENGELKVSISEEN